MKFRKYHAAGNDFIIIDLPEFSKYCDEKKVEFDQAARFLCDRHFGIGADGILLYNNSSKIVEMRILNSDGSEAMMCGNGIRSFLRYLTEKKSFSAESVEISTRAGIVPSTVYYKSSLFDSASVRLKRPETLENPAVFGIVFNNATLKAAAINMGNPHLVINGENLTDSESLEAAILFQKKGDEEVNVEVIKKIDVSSKSIEIIVNERGAGFTLACGTGGGAAAYFLFLNKIIMPGEEWEFHFPGGTIFYTVDESGLVTMRGDAKFVFEGEID